VLNAIGSAISSAAADRSMFKIGAALGAVTPVIDRTFPLSDVPAAIRYLRDGRASGKVVIT
jgi:NADPH:quinone reductase-like Zn-dependent oxidoreductase